MWFLFISGNKRVELIFNVVGEQYNLTRIHVGCVPGVLNSSHSCCLLRLTCGLVDMSLNACPENHFMLAGGSVGRVEGRVEGIRVFGYWGLIFLRDWTSEPMVL